VVVPSFLKELNFFILKGKAGQGDLDHKKEKGDTPPPPKEI